MGQKWNEISAKWPEVVGNRLETYICVSFFIFILEWYGKK